MIEIEEKAPKITKDGVTIVKNIERSDPLEEVACSVLRKAAHNTNVYCGDGTTTSTILAAAIFEKGQRMVRAGSNPLRLKKGIDLGRDLVMEFLEDIRDTQVDHKVLLQCARVATNYDEDLSLIISEAVEKKGLKGVIHMEPVPEPKSSLVVSSPSHSLRSLKAVVSAEASEARTSFLQTSKCTLVLF